MDSVTTSPQGSSSVVTVKISWSEPQTNGAAITSYNIKIKGKDNNYYNELVNCDGSEASVASNTNCYIFHAKLRQAPFNLVKGDKIYAIANAANIKGYNASFSVPNSGSATVEDVPVAMGSISRNNGGTSYNKLSLSFSGLSGTNNLGGQTCAITSYHVQLDQGNNTANTTTDVWTDIKGFATNDTSTSVNNYMTGIVGGTTYKVRVRALNKHGWGPWGPVSNVRCASAPSAPTSVTTANNTVYVTISWSLPFNNGLDVSAYKIEIARKSGTWSAHAECDGTNSTIVSLRTC